MKGEILCLSALYHREYNLNEHQLKVFKATSDPDTMYLHEYKKDPYWKEFITAIVKEVKYHMYYGKYSIILKSELPTGVTILPSVWQLKRNQYIKKRAIKKWKVNLNIDGNIMKIGINYKHIYVPI